MYLQKSKRLLSILTILAMVFTMIPASVFAEGEGGGEEPPPPATPLAQQRMLAANLKDFFINFDTNLTAVDKTKIAVKKNATSTVSSRNFTATVTDSQLKISLTSSLDKFANGGVITVGADAVTAANGQKNTSLSPVTIGTTIRFPGIAKTTLNGENTVATMEFRNNGSAVSLNDGVASLVSQIQVATDGKTYADLNAEGGVAGSAALVDNKVQVTFNAAVTNATTRIRVKAGALKMLTGSGYFVPSSTLTSANLDRSPTLLSHTISADNKTVTLKFSENIASATTPVPPKGEADSTLIGKIKLSTLGDFSEDPLTTPSSIRIRGDSLSATFAAKLTGQASKVKVLADGIQDLGKNKNAEVATNAIATDITSPVLYSAHLSKNRRTITLTFTENVKSELSTNPLNVASWNGKFKINSANVNPKSVVISKRQVIINLNAAAPSGALTFDGETTIQDAAGNYVAQSTMTPDGTAPRFSSYSLNEAKTELTVTFTEEILSTSRKKDSLSVAKHVRGLVRKGSTVLTAADAITIDSEDLKITFATALTNTDVIRFAANIFEDKAGNENASFNLEFQGPQLTEVTATDLTNTEAKLNFKSNEAGTYFILVLAAGDSAPDAATIVAQGDSVTKGTGVAKRWVSTNATSRNTVALSSMTAGTAYKAHLVVRDVWGNVSLVSTTEFSTTPAEGGGGEGGV